MSRRRSLEGDEDASDDSAPVSSQGSKRRRLNDEPADTTNDALLPDSFRRSPRANRVNRHAEEKHQPGAIVRIKVKNFVTYTNATFNCGPSLNMIIGPNGTGKSTLVCAICLGLGSKTSVLGRAKAIGEYVKHGSREAEIEVELAAKEGQTDNIVIQHTIKREGNKSFWKVNDRQTTHKEVMTLVRSLNIQVDNLCQFLPQDRVVEFAQMTPVGLLESTQKAAAEEHMTVWHTQLKELGSQRINMQATHTEREKQLDALEKRQAQQQSEVDRMRERKGLMTRLQALEMARPALRYRIEKEKWDEMKQTKRQYEAELRTLTTQVAPALREVETKEKHVRQLKEAVNEAEGIYKRFDQETEKKCTAVEKKKTEITECETEHNTEVAAHKSRRTELNRLETQIRNMQNAYDNEPVEFDASFYNAQIREKDQQIRDLRNQAEAIKGQENEIKLRAQSKRSEWDEAKRELSDLQTASGQQLNRLRKLSEDTAKALVWIRKNPQAFKDKIYGPPLIECTVKDPRYASAVESLMSKGDFLCLTATNKDDWNTLRAVCQNQLKLKDIHQRVANRPLSFWESPMSKEDLVAHGLEEFAIDLVQGPEPILSMLCDSARLHRTGVSLHNSTDEQFERLKESTVQNWVAGRSSYRVNRRREYGPSAVSTVVIQVKQATQWTSAGVDTEAQRLAQLRMKDIERGLAELDDERSPIEGELKKLKAQQDTLDEQKKGIAQEKSDRQRAHSQWMALPKKIESLQVKVADVKKDFAQVHERLDEIRQRKQTHILQQAQMAIDHTIALEKSMQIQEELIEFEIQCIEAESELEHLNTESQRVRDMLKQREREIIHFAAQISQQTDLCKGLVKEIKAGQQRRRDMENGDELDDLMNAWLGGQNLDGDEGTTEEGGNRTVDDLDADILSTRQRIELLHEGNPRALEQFEQRARDIERMKNQIANFQETLHKLNKTIDELRQKWEPELDGLVERISAAFAHNFERIGCAGQVSVRKDETDFREWAIQIEVKFRENEELAILDSHRQSGGERAVSTIFYLMALQSMARSPFRVVDEINQGMDPRNERMVHERMVNIACSENTSQYFLVTPKLLNGLKYHPRMVVHVIFSGDEMPANDGEMEGKLDFKYLAEKALQMGRVH